MLVLSRKTNESLLLGDEIVIKIVSVSGDRVRIAIDAPIRVRVLRAELAPKITDGQASEMGVGHAG